MGLYVVTTYMFTSCTLMLVLLFVVCFFFFKQKTAYEMRISDWSSDVCSSDLPPVPWLDQERNAEKRERQCPIFIPTSRSRYARRFAAYWRPPVRRKPSGACLNIAASMIRRSGRLRATWAGLQWPSPRRTAVWRWRYSTEEVRGGTGWGSTCKSR